MDAANVYDFIVVGSGPGGGPLACNLALDPKGYRVALVEAGVDPAEYPGSPTFYNYSVPILYTRASEDPRISWQFFVQHYADKKRQSKDYDSKYYDKDGNQGIFYPRAAAIGGCAAHHAMITVRPHRADWENMRTLLTKDDPTVDKSWSASWSADKMQPYFQKIESCQYLRPRPGQTSDPATGHGFDGWLPLSMPDPTLGFTDDKLLHILLRAFLVAEIDLELPEDDRGPDKLQATLTDKKILAPALKKAVQRLVKTAERAAAHLSLPARQTLASLKPEIDKLLKEPDKPGGKSPADVAALLSAYVRDIPSLSELFQLVFAWLDPNRLFPSDQDRVGPFSTPGSILHGVRTGVRERILNVRALYPDRLHLITGAFVTRVLLDDAKKKAIGVEYLKKEGIYQATPSERLQKGDVPPRQIYVRDNGEVILAGGAFNTPQLLMLSGIGPKDHLEKNKIDLACDLPGVGQNLQDRYEICVIADLLPVEKPKFTDFTVLDGCTFQAPGDECGAKPKLAPGQPPTLDKGLTDWLNHRGVYATNGAVMTIIKRSGQAEKEFGSYIPDIFIFGLPGYFKGYYVGYSCDIEADKINDTEWKPNHHRFTWAILKGRTHNQCGSVRLRSSNPLERPDILFRSFDSEPAADGPQDTSCKKWPKDVAALVEAVQFVKVLMDDANLNAKIVWPNVDLNDKDALGDFILKEAWGHHACGTCKIDTNDDKWAVLDGDFRVRGIENLRVVDASVFPTIPGFFIISSIYMISEKASDVILQDRKLADGGNARKWPKPAGG